MPSNHFFTDCNGQRLLGGYQVLTGDNSNPAYLQKTWSNLPPHFTATISMKAFKIDSWNSDSLFVMVDGISQQIVTWGLLTGTSNMCGDQNPFINTYNPQYNEFTQSISVTFTHKASSLTLKLISSLKSWTGSWGIRELNISLTRCHLSCLTCSNATNCETCDTANGLSLVGQFCECSGTTKLIQTDCPVTRCVTCISTLCPSG